MCVKAAALRRGFALGQLRAYPIGTTQSKRSSLGAFAEKGRKRIDFRGWTRAKNT
jgi:hypothetical protein